MSGIYPFEQKCGKQLIANLPDVGEWLWLYASVGVPKFGPHMNIQPLMRALKSIVTVEQLQVPIQPGRILGKVRVVNITRANARQWYPHIPLFPEVCQILHIVERLVLPKGFAVSGLPRFDRWPQLNEQQRIDLFHAETQALGPGLCSLSMSDSEDDSDWSPPAKPKFEATGVSKPQDGDGSSLEDDESEDEWSKPPAKPMFEQDTQAKPLFEQDIQPSLEGSLKHPRSTRDVALLGPPEIIREKPVILAFQSNIRDIVVVTVLIIITVFRCEKNRPNSQVPGCDY
jgi:hypothetical protein